jgi:hypothetical protein
MDENKESVGYLGKLAMVSDALDNLHEGTKIVVFEVKKDDYDMVKNVVKPSQVGEDNSNFKIEISGNEFIFLLSE